MQVLFETRDPQAAGLRDLVVTRARFAMRRLSWGVPRARVSLSDINGPRGGVDKRCQVELKTDTAGTVVITAVARDWRTALDQALARAARVLLRAWRRGNSAQRRHAGHDQPATPTRLLTSPDL